SNFYAKLKLQLADGPPEVHKVAVDAYAFYQLPVAIPTTAEYKLARIREMIDWKLSNDQPDQTLLVKAFTEEWDHGNRLAPGLMNPGRFYLAAMPLQIAFYLDFAKTVLIRRADTSD